MIRKSANRRRLGFEGLERRELLAGNVSAGLDVNGNLVLTGDLENNHVVVTRAFFSGQLLVNGGRSNPSDPNSATRINGSTSSLAFNTTGGIVLDMSDGNDNVLVTNLGVQGNITGNLGKGSDQLALESNSDGLLSFTLNNGTSPAYAKVSTSGLVNVSGNDGSDVFSLYNATIGGSLTFNGGNGDDSFVSTGTSHSSHVVGGSVLISPGAGNDATNMRRLAVGQNLTVNDGQALTKTRVGLVNVRVNLDITLNLSIRKDVVNLRGEDTGSNRFQARNVVINTGNGGDQVVVDKGIMLNVTVSTGEGDDRANTAYGARLTNLAVNDRFYLDTDGGRDSAFIKNVSADVFRVYTLAGDDSVTADIIEARDALFDTGDGADVVGIHDASTYRILSIFLGANDDILRARSVIVTSDTLFDGGLGFNTFTDQGGNSFASLTRVNI
jgi:hypothetical protein